MPPVGNYKFFVRLGRRTASFLDSVGGGGGVATRYAKTISAFKDTVILASIILWLKLVVRELALTVSKQDVHKHFDADDSIKASSACGIDPKRMKKIKK